MTLSADEVATRAPETADVAEQIKALKDEIAIQHHRIAELEAQRPSAMLREHVVTEQPSRRDVLRRAGKVGIAAAGAVGGMALMAPQAAATDGSAVIAGANNTEQHTTTLTIGPTVAAVSPVFAVNTNLGGYTFTTALQATATSATDTAMEANGDASSPTASAIGLYAHTTTGVGVHAIAAGVGGFALSGQAGGVDGLSVVAWPGGRANVSLVPNGAAGPPTTHAHYLGDIVTDSKGQLWLCVTSGTPGVFAPLQTGGANVSHFVRVAKGQYYLTASDGATWMDIDATKLKVVVTPPFNAQAVITVNSDVWTANPGLNQDVGIYVEGGAYGAAGSGKIVAWKESGGFAGTFSPNALYLETTQPLAAGTAYTVTVRWKTNKPASGGTIYAGAGPLPPDSAGGGVAGDYSPTRLSLTLIQDGPNPATLGAAASAPLNDPTKLPAANRAASRVRG